MARVLETQFSFVQTPTVRRELGSVDDSVLLQFHRTRLRDCDGVVWVETFKATQCRPASANAIDSLALCRITFFLALTTVTAL